MPNIGLPLSVALVVMAGAAVWIDGRDQDVSFQAGLCRARLCDAASMEDLADHPIESGAAGEGEALRFRQLALRNDPASPFRWCDLAEAYLEENNIRMARFCFLRGEALGPRNPAILMRVANFYFQTNELPDALRRTARVLERVPDYNAVIFSNYSRFNVPSSMIFEIGIPARKEPAQAYLKFLFASGAAAETQLAWLWASSQSFLDDSLAALYVNRLWEQRQFSAAEEAWASYLRDRRGDFPRPNRIFNGDFEQAPTASVLDWNEMAFVGTQTSRDSTLKYHGNYSLRVQFEGTGNLDFHHISQSAAVAPGVYRFQLYVKAAGLTTDEGVAFRLFDSESPGRWNLATEPILGTVDWRKLEKTVEIRSPTRAITVQIVRKPSLKFDNKISGTLWIDNVSLVPLPRHMP